MASHLGFQIDLNDYPLGWDLAMKAVDHGKVIVDRRVTLHEPLSAKGLQHVVGHLVRLFVEPELFDPGNDALEDYLVAVGVPVNPR